MFEKLVSAALRSPWKLLGICLVTFVVEHSHWAALFLLAAVASRFYGKAGKGSGNNPDATSNEEPRSKPEATAMPVASAVPESAKPIAPQYAKSAVVIPIKVPKQHDKAKQAVSR
jgi:hypothetical protein